MERRAFLAAGTSAALMPQGGSEPPKGEPAAPERPLLLELRRYRLHTGLMATRFAAHVETALIPALNRAGVAPVGAWNVALGGAGPTLHLLLPHASAESLTALEQRLEGDEAFCKAAGALRGLPSADPPFLRCDSSLHVTIASMPRIEKPAAAASGPGRIFELRTYRSHSEAASRKKVGMFEAGGELSIFKRLGLATVFFSRDLAGEGLPSLSYLLVFADAAAREAAWTAFRQDPEWRELRAKPQYADEEIVSGISSLLLRPAAGSQL